MPSVIMLRRVRLHAICGRFRTEIFEKFSRPQIFAFEIARERAEIRAARRRAALPRPLEVPKHCAERRHAAAREIACDFRPKFSKNFAGRKILHSKSREIAPKSMPPGGAQLAHDPTRSQTTMPSVSMLRRMRLHAIRNRFRTEIFEKFSRPQNFLFEIA